MLGVGDLVAQRAALDAVERILGAAPSFAITSCARAIGGDLDIA